MRRKLSIVLAVVVIASLIAMPASAQTSAAGRTPARQAPIKLTPVNAEDLDGVTFNADKLPSKARSSEVRRYTVELADAPLAKLWIDAQQKGLVYDKATAEAYAKGLADKQAAVAKVVQSLGGKVLANYSKVFNGLAIELATNRVAELYKTPGVVSVLPIPEYRIDLDETVPWIGAAALQAAGYDGTGIRVAVIDSGIDYTHEHLGGSGLQADTDQALAEASQPADPRLFPTAKVIGGYDFVGSNWPFTPEEPDPNPMDDEAGGVDGHGTHVASIIGGVQTASLGPGVAPGVEFYALKVCSSVSTSCSGVALLQAYDWAADPNGDYFFNDRADVVNLSLGSVYGQPRSADTAAVSMLTGLGSVVVISAGNSGNMPYITGAPSVARPAISVAQTSVPSSILYRIRRNAPEPVRIIDAVWQPWSLFPTEAITGDIIYGNGDGTNLTGCVPFTADMTGKVALINRGGCTFTSKVLRAEAAGASMAIIALVAPGDPFEGGWGGEGYPQIPAFMISQANGNLLKVAGANVSIDPNDPSITIPLLDVMVGSSSRGPAFDLDFVKPNIGAPGASVSASSGHQSYAAFGGTSGAAPMVAGSAALLLQAAGGSGSIPPVVVKAKLMNNAVKDTWQDVPGGMLNPITRQGAGRVDVQAAAAAETIAWVPGDNDVALSFGFETVSAPWMATKTVEVINTSTDAKTYDIKAAFRYANDEGAGVEPMLSTDTLTVPAGGKGTFDVTLKVTDPLMLKAWPFTSGSTFANGNLLTSVEYDGFLTLATPARVRVAHASPDAPAVDILVNDAVAFSNVPFKAISDYAALPAGTYNIKVVPTGATEPVVIEADLTLAGGTDYTVAAVGQLANIEALVLEDNNAKPAMGNAHVRFVHASPDAPAVDIAVAGGGPVLFSNVAFKEAEGPIPVPAGSYDLEVRLAGTDTVVLSIPGVALADQTVYTVFAMGLAGGTPALEAVPAVDAMPDDPRSEVINLPWHFLPRQAADVMVGDAVQAGPASFAVPLMNSSVVTGSVEVYPLFDVSPQITVAPTAWDVLPADLKYVGADVIPWDVGENLLLFPVTSWTDRSHPITVEYDVWIDIDQDGVDDYVAYNSTVNGTADPRAVSVLVDLAAGTATLQFFLDSTINSDTMVIPVVVPDDDYAFNFQVFAFDAYFTGYLWDVSPADAFFGVYHTFDAMFPAYTADEYSFDVPAEGDVDSMVMAHPNAKSPSQIGMLYRVWNGVSGGEAFAVELPAFPAINRSKRFNLSADTFIDQTRPNVAFGSASTMWVGYSDNMRPVVKADFTGIPSDSIVTKAYLYVYVTEGRGYSQWVESVMDVSAHVALAPWDEATTTWNSPWSAPGGDVSPAIDVLRIGSARVGTWLRFDVTDAVAMMVSGQMDNNGFVIASNRFVDVKADDALAGARFGLAAQEYWDPSRVGYLRIMYQTIVAE